MRLMLTATGMVTCVGHDAVTSCSAIRAGIIRSYEVGHFSLLEEDLQEPKPLIGRPIHGFTEGFSILGFWIRAGLACLRDLVKSANLPNRSDAKFWSATGVIAATPPVADARFESDESFTAANLKKIYLLRLTEVFDYPISFENMNVIATGHTGAVSAVASAQSMMTSRQLERVIVLATDSYLDPMTLDWLAAHDRLKTAANPVGLIPGEAASCFQLESETSAKARGASLAAVVHDPALAAEKNNFFSGNRNHGLALSGVISRALAQSGTKTPFAGNIISDLNGEDWRAYELACARVRMAGQIAAEAHFTLPSNSIGEVGSASGGVAVCMVARSFQRRYSRSDTALVVSSSDYGQVGAMVLSKPADC